MNASLEPVGHPVLAWSQVTCSKRWYVLPAQLYSDPDTWLHAGDPAAVIGTA